MTDTLIFSYDRATDCAFGDPKDVLMGLPLESWLRPLFILGADSLSIFETGPEDSRRVHLIYVRGFEGEGPEFKIQFDIGSPSRIERNLWMFHVTLFRHLCAFAEKLPLFTSYEEAFSGLVTEVFDSWHKRNKGGDHASSHHALDNDADTGDEG